MDFPDLGSDKEKMDATVSGSAITGRWNYGIYRFTVTKQEAEGDEETARISKQFKGEFGINSALGKYYDPVTIFVYPTFIHVARNPDVRSAPKGYSGDNILSVPDLRRPLWKAR